MSEQLPPDPFTDPRRAAAYHEAGHAVIGLHLGFDLIGIELRDDPDSDSAGAAMFEGDGPTEHELDEAHYDDQARAAVERWALMGWAGTLAAELSGADVAALAGGVGLTPIGPNLVIVPGSDLARLVGFADAIAIAIGPGEVDVWLEWTCSRCLGLVQQMWPVIERVAARLLEAGQLSGEQVRAEWQRCRRALP